MSKKRSIKRVPLKKKKHNLYAYLKSCWMENANIRDEREKKKKREEKKKKKPRGTK